MSNKFSPAAYADFIATTLARDLPDWRNRTHAELAAFLRDSSVLTYTGLPFDAELARELRRSLDARQRRDLLRSRIDAKERLRELHVQPGYNQIRNRTQIEFWKHELVRIENQIKLLISS